ncbi:MAG TPA: arginine deiminase family protein [Anaerolineales bacterium]|nr:arginine deiminase family protein [Anaerolineales bacterium]
MTIAITREVSPRFDECEITHIDRSPINLEIAHAQHREYIQALKALGCEVIELPAETDLPDSVFVEDTAFILPEAAVITRPGAASRRPETDSIARALEPYRNLLFIREPATVDGGDVLVLGKDIFVGMSTRSSRAAVDQMNELLAGFGYSAHPVEMHDCLHLKTAVTRVDERTLLINPSWLESRHFAGFDCIEIDPAEPFAANCLPVNGEIIFPAVFPKTLARLAARGYKVRDVQVDELAKAEGAVTCCSLMIG